MSAAGALLGLACGVGLVLIALSLAARRRPSLEDRVVPYLHDLPLAPRMATERPRSWVPTAVGAAVFGPSVARLARGVERVLGGGTTVRLQLQRLGTTMTLEQFRVQQVLWGLGWFAAAAALGLLWSLRTPVPALPMLVVCLIAFAVGVVARDQSLGRAVSARERRMVEEFPTISDLMALSVAAGEGPVAALERVVATSHGELSVELRRVLGEIRTGASITRAFDGLAARTGIPIIARFAEGLAVAVERGTPLVDVLHAQAADVREASRRELIEAGARKEVAMMVPVVFLILPITVVFAFYPGFIGLSLTSP